MSVFANASMRWARWLALPLCSSLGAGALFGCEGAISSPKDERTGPEGDPGTLIVHRLNNTEYANTVRDLLGTSLDPTKDFPADDYSHGFDNISAALSMSPVQVAQYHSAAAKLAAEALRDGIVEAGVRKQTEDIGGSPNGRRAEAGEEVGGIPGGTVQEAAWMFFLPGSITVPMEVEVAGVYAIETRAYARQAGDEAAKLDVTVDGQLVKTFSVEALVDNPEVYRVELELPVGDIEVGLGFPNDFFIPEEDRDRNLYIDWVQLKGPVGADGKTPIRDRLMVCDPDPDKPVPCVREIVESFGKRAWRRPLSKDEVDRAVSLFEVARGEGGSVHDGLQLIVEDMLASPHFLFRFEIDPDPFSATPRALNGYELASRLSYFLWSTMPDDELFEAAEDGTLVTVAGLEKQVDRMLADPKATALVENFAAQWLFLRGMDSHEADYELYPSFDDELRVSMVEETSRFFSEFLQSDLSVDQLLTADFTFLNARLAEHYGVELPASTDEDGFARVSLAGTPRRGLLTQGSLLTVTSHPDRTSPVKRGQWVLEQILCSPPPPPPPGVEGLDGEGAPIEGSVRERMEQHRTDPLCISCHEAMDPIGFSLEHFDAIGAWRDVDGPYEIDATGQLPSGETFDGAAELGPVLGKDVRFTECLTEQMLTYALGRGIEREDSAHIDRIHSEFIERGATLRELIHIIAQSDPFMYRRGEVGSGN